MPGDTGPVTMTTATKTYEVVERVHARPMNRGEYIAFRGWQLPADENPADDGYLVECMGDFISWCPKDRFERTYCEVGQGMSAARVTPADIEANIASEHYFTARGIA